MGDFRLPHDMRAKDRSGRKAPMRASAIAAIPADLAPERARLGRKTLQPEQPSERVRHAARLIAEGKTPAELADLFGIKPKSAMHLIREARRAGLIETPPPKPGPAPATVPPRVAEAARAARKHKTLDKIAAALGVPKDTARHYLSLARRAGLDVRRRNQRDPHLDAKIVAAARQPGASVRHIANKVAHCRDAYVVEVLAREGVEIKRHQTGFASKGKNDGR